MAISFYSEDTNYCLKNRRLLANWVKSCIANEGKKCGDISFIFCSDDHLLSINRQYLQHDYYTDVITFDYCTGDIVSGDIFVSVDTVRENSALFNKAFLDELHRVIIHGILHLCGHGDKSDQDASKMRLLEDNSLNLLPNK
ncbi:rRNA maturation RNase YbeY [Williamwhitmania taraxaci]|uniref:Endoribonuclease YbeY n=1 Tax=Williamwhitmania taraxaci TaxID=1640674 RepID=A0A1G6GXU2_9BACT|nr:rRNA maturation RNase YbeY [Williamwhitmania taraxaci]SDB86799.1 rRNA maturation RNase YbeY [Williamwhitmania taraxaci]